MNFSNITSDFFDYSYSTNCRKLLANREIEEHSTDSPKFRIKFDKNSENLKHYKYWEENPFTYKFNNYGFRTNDNFYPSSKGNMFLGCSHTEGIGWPIEETWSKVVHDKIGGENFFNFGTEGASISRGRRYLQAWAPILSVTNVFVCFPHPFRYEFHDNTKKEFYTVLSHEFKNFNNKDVKISFTDDFTAFDYYIANLSAILTTCEKFNINMYYIPQVIFRPSNYEEKEDRAPRDFLHCYKSGQEYIVKQALDLYENKKIFTHNDLYNTNYMLG